MDKEQLETLGYCVVRNVLTPQEIEDSKTLFWDWMEQCGSNGLSRSSTKTWQRDNLPPHKRFGLFKEGGIAHSQFLWSLRLHNGVRRVFSELWNDDDLLVSYDGATANLYNPDGTSGPGKNGVKDPKKSESECRERSSLSSGAVHPHWDQDFDKQGLHCVQGLVALTDSPNSEHGGFSCWPRSHIIHKEYCDANHAMCKVPNWHMLTTKDKKLLQERGMHRLDVPYNAGDMVLWRSDLVHSGRAPSMNLDMTQSPRMVAYVCMTPRSFINGPGTQSPKKMGIFDPEQMLAKKRHAFYNGIQTTHWPHDQYPVDKNPEHCPKFLPNPAWFTSDAQARLAGFFSLDQMQNRK